MAVIRNTAKHKAMAGELVLGMGVRQSRTADHALICRAAGFDWIFIDLEHSSLSVEQASNMCCAALTTGVMPFVRVTAQQHFHATRLLDTGAIGVIVPDVDTAAQAAAMVHDCRYPPLGKRSIPSAVPQLGFEPTPPAEMMRLVNEEVMLVAMLESPTAIANADAIAATEGLDAVIIGGSDLTARYGVPGDFEAAPIRAAFTAAAAAAERHGKVFGFAGVADEARQKEFIAMGARFVQCGTDIGFMHAAASARVAALRAA